ncbi:hypothetical protein [Rhodococcus marinonascens]|uniref:hypothetical protein n=1 Tax=Rhodococcus marinonascens TaxID=38311 RepID=UPI000A007E6A|nr:hypothetical protein [Rhodococcus marinonascens]
MTSSVKARKADFAARFVTEIAAPWTVNIAAPLLVGAYAGSWRWGAVVALFSGVLPMLMILWEMRRDRVGDHHVTQHDQRHRVLAAILALVAAALVLQLVFGAPQQTVGLTVAGLATLLAIGVWTSIVHIKASVHTAVWSGSVAIIGLAISPWWWLLLALTPVIGWARLHLRDHTLTQILIGTGTGLVVAPITYAVVTALY